MNYGTPDWVSRFPSAAVLVAVLILVGVLVLVAVLIGVLVLILVIHDISSGYLYSRP